MNFFQVGKSHSFIFHSACIWGLEIFPHHDPDPSNASPAGAASKPVLPPGSFITCSSDDTIRIWNLSQNMSQATIYRRNIYSEDLLKILYVDGDLSHIKEQLDTSVNVGNGGGDGNKDGGNKVRIL
jgi:WD40 repeat protein